MALRPVCVADTRAGRRWFHPSDWIVPTHRLLDIWKPRGVRLKLSWDHAGVGAQVKR